MVYTTCKKPDLKHVGYAVLHSMTYPLMSTSAIREAAHMPMEYTGMKVKNLYEFLISSFPGEEALKAEKNRTLRNPILSYVVNKLDDLTLMVG